MVLALKGDKMDVRYEDGTESSLKISIQERIWENIVAEQHAEEAKATKSKKKTLSTTSHYIKTLTISEDDDLSIPGLKQRVAVASKETILNPGDRLIYYASDKKLFFAVATVTTKPKKGKAIDYQFGPADKTAVHVYPIDVDAHIIITSAAVAVETTELESVSEPTESLAKTDEYYKISEDDFELLSELITEAGDSAEEELPDEQVIDDDILDLDD